jgi:peptide methionine sulfoxide reductase MsrA
VDLCALAVIGRRRKVSTSATARTTQPVQEGFANERPADSRPLQAFWRIHNPTTRNRQGFDFGSQYRSAATHVR